VELFILRIGGVSSESKDLLVLLSMLCRWIELFHLIFNYLCYVVVRSLFHVSTISEVSMKLLMEKGFVPMSTVALCSRREFLFLEVRFDSRLPRCEIEHHGSYCPIPYEVKCYT